MLSPLLANIYLHELDTFIEDTLIPHYTRGQKRKKNREYGRLEREMNRAKARNDLQAVIRLQQERRACPSQDTHDPNYRRLSYVRYADDFLLGYIGPKAEAEAIKQAIGTFLRDKLHLTLSEEKTLITHARTEQARFLNYAISMYHRLTQAQQERVASLALAGKEIMAERVKDILRAQINTGLVPVQDALAQGWNATASHLPVIPNTSPFLAQPRCEELAEQIGCLGGERMQEACQTASTSSLSSLLATLLAFEHCPDYRTAPQAVQTLSQALMQQLLIALRDAPPAALPTAQHQSE